MNATQTDLLMFIKIVKENRNINEAATLPRPNIARLKSTTKSYTPIKKKEYLRFGLDFQQ